jgi:serralysin
MFLNHVAAAAGSNAVLPPPALPDEAIEAESAQNGPGGPGSVVAETSGGLVINLLFDAAAMAAPQSFRQGIEQAAAILSGAISDKITVNLNIDYSGTGGGAAAGPDNGQYVSYTTVRADLINDATPGDTTFNALPSGSTIQGQSSVAVWNAQLKLFGLLGANDTTTDDGSATFATDINPNLLVGVALHELTHAMGRVPYGPQPDVFDLFRFTSPGTRLFLNGATAPAAYFSLDGGTTKLADYGQTSDASDFLNSGVQGSNDPFNEFYSGSTLQQLTAIDLKQLDALGFHLISSQPTVIEAFGSTSLVEQIGNFYLDSISSGTGPELKYNGANVVAGQFGSGWTPVGTEQTSTGYEVAWQLAGSEQFTIWATDSSGNYTATVAAGSGTSLGIEQAESILHQDLNGDGVIGVASTVIEAFGSTRLVELGSNFFLNNISSGTGPELKYDGAAVAVGQFGSGWTPVGTEQTSTGYEVAWQIAGSEQFTIWATDSNGNYTATVAAGSGTSLGVEQAESILHQDLNGDGVIGVASTVIEAFGSTSLVELGSNFYLNNISSGTGPELKYNGAAIAVGQFGSGWTPVGTEQTSTGYEVAWQIAGSEQFTIWATDSNGNYTATVAAGSGTSLGVEQAESILHQDLNGDGVIGVPSGNSVAAQAVIVAAAGSSANDAFAFLPAANESPFAGSASAPDVGVLSNTASGNQAAAFWSDLSSGYARALFQSASGGHIAGAEAGNHDGQGALNGFVAEFLHGFIIH